MTVDEANTALAIASNKASRLAAYQALSLAATRAAAEIEHNPDQNDRYALITRLIEARNVLELAAQYLTDREDPRGQHHAVVELDLAMTHITQAIDAL